MGDWNPKVLEELQEMKWVLEGHFKDMQDLEFTIQDEKLWMLQTRSGKRTAQAAVRIAVDMAGRSTATKMIGQDVAMPVAIAPVGLCGMQSADGEIKAARAAEKFGIPFTLSTMSICSIEDVAENTSKPFWIRSA